MAAASKWFRGKSCSRGGAGRRPTLSLGKAEDAEEELGKSTQRYRREGPRHPKKDSQHNVGKIRAAMLVAVLAGESPAGGNCSVATVVISGSGASDQAAGSPEVKVSVGWRETFGQLRQGGERVGRL
jgi:hypothetical protein